MIHSPPVFEKESPKYSLGGHPGFLRQLRAMQQTTNRQDTISFFFQNPALSVQTLLNTAFMLMSTSHHNMGAQPDFPRSATVHDTSICINPPV
jgi:hypothetical protein